MILLAIDTSAEFCAVCLYDVETASVLSKQSDNIGRGHAERLMPMIDECLNAASLGYENISGITVTNGPGSFTGVRVGLAAARGFGLSLNIPVSTVTTLEACIEEARKTGCKDKIVAIIDARRDEAYVQVDGETASIRSYQEIASRLPKESFSLCGSGAQKFNETSDTRHEIIHNYSTGDIETIARMVANQKSEDTSLEPLYLRSADAKPQSGFTLKKA